MEYVSHPFEYTNILLFRLHVIALHSGRFLPPCYSMRMRRIRRSFGHSLDGFMHAMQMERNLQLFVPVYIIVLVLGGFLRLLPWEWLALIIAGMAFMSVELLNTAVERLTDVFDDQRKSTGRSHYHSTFKAAKDVGAAASLVSLITVITVIVVVFWPYVELYLL